MQSCDNSKIGSQCTAVVCVWHYWHYWHYWHCLQTCKLLCASTRHALYSRAATAAVTRPRAGLRFWPVTPRTPAYLGLSCSVKGRSRGAGAGCILQKLKIQLRMLHWHALYFWVFTHQHVQSISACLAPARRERTSSARSSCSTSPDACTSALHAPKRTCVPMHTASMKASTCACDRCTVRW